MCTQKKCCNFVNNNVSTLYACLVKTLCFPLASQDVKSIRQSIRNENEQQILNGTHSFPIYSNNLISELNKALN